LTKKELQELEKGGWLKRGSKDHRLPGREDTPDPPMGFRVIFVAFLLHGLSVLAHEFLRGLLFVYGMQLHDLTPNMVLHIACFITLCECFLGIEPHWALWKRIFSVKRHRPSPAGGFGCRVRPEI
jgi:hypothetical protein